MSLEDVEKLVARLRDSQEWASTPSEIAAELEAALRAEGQDGTEVKLFDLVAETRDKLRPFLVMETFKTGEVPATYLAVDIILQEAFERAAAPSLHKERPAVRGTSFRPSGKRPLPSGSSPAAALHKEGAHGLLKCLEPDGPSQCRYCNEFAPKHLPDCPGSALEGHKEGAGGACGEPAGYLIAGASWFACVLPKGHEGAHQRGGNCFKHGEYVGNQCPHWPECIPGAASPAGRAEQEKK